MKQPHRKASLVALTLLATVLPTSAHGQPAITYAQWTKFCARHESQPCFSGTYTRSASERWTGIALLIQQQSSTQMTLRVTVALGVQLGSGIRIDVDGANARTASYLGCDPTANGCFADFGVDEALMSRLKTGNQLVAQTTHMDREQTTLQFPLATFRQAAEGRSQDKAGPGPLQKSAAFGLDKNRPQFTERQLRALSYSGWEKACRRDWLSGQQTCVTATDGRLKDGLLVVSAAVLEFEEHSRKMLRIRVPYGTDLSHGVRLAVDQNQIGKASIIFCLPASTKPTGCIADVELTATFMSQLVPGRTLNLSAIQKNGSPLAFAVPAANFQKTFDRPRANAQ